MPSLYIPMNRFESIDYKRCRVSVYGGRAGSHQCSRAVIVTVDDVGYCRQHAPSGSLPDAPEPVILYAAYVERGAVRVSTAQAHPTSRGWNLEDTSAPFGYHRRIPRDRVGTALRSSGNFRVGVVDGEGYLGETRLDALLALQRALQSAEVRLQSKLDTTRIALQDIQAQIADAPLQTPPVHED